MEERLTALSNTHNESKFCNGPHSNERHVLKILYLCGGSVSLFFCLVIFFISLLFHKYHQSTQRLVLYLTLAVSLLSIANILHGIEPNPNQQSNFCRANGFIDQITSWMVLLAECCITFELFHKVVFLKFDTNRFEPLYCVIIFLFPFTFNWIPFIKDAYGPAGDQCWMRLHTDPYTCDRNTYYITIRFILYWIPFVIGQIMNFIVYIGILVLTRVRMNRYHGQYDPDQHRIRIMIHKEIRGYLPYPILLLIASCLGVTSRIIEVADSHQFLFGLKVVHALAISFQGVAIAMVFALDQDTRKQLCNYKSIKAAFRRLFCCCCFAKRSVSVYGAIPGGSLTDSLHTSSLYGSTNTNVVV